MPIMFNEIFNNHFQGKKLICYENSENIINIESFKGFNDFHIILGPEGGFTINEIEKANGSGFESISLGKNILKCFFRNCVIIIFIYV